MPFFAYSDSEIEQVTRARTAFDDAGAASKREAELKSRLAAERANWNAEREARGVPALDEAEKKAGKREDELCRSILCTRATTPAGALAKLEVAISFVPEDDFDDYPWPFILGAIDDLQRLAQPCWENHNA